MARYILGNEFRASSERWPVLRHGLWLLDRTLIGGAVQALGLVSVDRASRVGRRLGMWLGPRLHKHRHLRQNLALAFPGHSAQQIEQLAVEAWGNAGAVFAEYAHLETICTREAEERLLVSPLPSELSVFREPGRRAVFVGAHLANWEVALATTLRMGVRGAAVYNRPVNPWTDRLLRHWRNRLGWRLVARQDGLRRLVRELQRGGSVALLVDRRVENGEPIPFFGVDKPTTTIPARLALRFDCELVPVRTERLGDARFRVTFYPPVKPDTDTADEALQAAQMMHKVNALFESWIRAAPQDWFCSKRGTARRRTGEAQSPDYVFLEPQSGEHS